MKSSQRQMSALERCVRKHIRKGRLVLPPSMQVDPERKRKIAQGLKEVQAQEDSFVDDGRYIG